MKGGLSILKKAGWAAGLGLALGGFAGLCDGVFALWENPGLAKGKELFLFFSYGFCCYGLLWALALFWYGLLLIGWSRISKKPEDGSPEFTAQIISAGLTMQIYVATIVWLNDRFLPYSTSIKSIAGNVLYLLLMAVAYCLVYLPVKPAVSRARNLFASRFLKRAVHVLAFFFICNLVWVLLGNPWAAAGAGPRKTQGKTGPDVNVILILVDALRPDHLSCYGYQRSKTPNIDLLAEQGVRFENALSNAPQTFLSVSSMFTSNYPDALSFCQLYPIHDAFPTLAETLSQAGINTAGVLTNPYLSPALQITRGFNYFYHSFEPGFLRQIKGTHLNFFAGRILNRIAFEENAEDQTGRAINWLKKNRDQPFFFWLYLMEAHFPYGDVYIKDAPPDPGYKGKLGDHLNDSGLAMAMSRGKIDLSAEDIRHIEYLYDRDIRYADAQLGKLFKYLQDNGLWEKTAIILIADHGEAFYEHKMVGHCNHLYWEYTHIPLLVKLPGTHVKTVSAPVELLDLYPTILDIFQVEAPATIRGKSLLGLMRGETVKHKDYFYSACTRYVSPEIFLRDSRYTLLYHPREKDFMLFDRSLDPLESKDISREQPEIAQQLLSELISIKRSNRQLFLKYHPKGMVSSKVNLNQSILRSLGYVK